MSKKHGGKGPAKPGGASSARDRERAREREQERLRTEAESQGERSPERNAPGRREPEPQGDGSPGPPRDTAGRDRHERRVDETVEETFPASDPPARTALSDVGTRPVAPSGEPRITWLRDVDQGFAESGATGRPVLLDFSAAPT